MAVLSKGLRQSMERDQAKEQREREELVKAERKRAEQRERRLLREIEREDAAIVDPPPELSPAETRERELLARVERLEGNASRDVSIIVRPLESTKQHQRREELRLLRIRKAAEEQTLASQQHEHRCAKQIAQLEQELQAAEQACAAERERDAAAGAELEARRASVTDKLARLRMGLAPGETTEDRLQALELAL